MFEDTRLALNGLCIYRNILRDPVMDKFSIMLERWAEDGADVFTTLEGYNEFLFTLASTRHSFKGHLLYLMAHDSNPFSQEAELKAFSEINPYLLEACRNDLAWLQKIYNFDWSRVGGRLNSTGSDRLAGWDWDSLRGVESEPLGGVLGNSPDWTSELEKLVSCYRTNGSGIVSVYRAMRWDARRNKLVGIKHPDPVVLQDLVGYQSQKEQLCRNTEQFLHNYPANNVLLYGSRGTGKSTMVKSLLNEYYDQGLRMVEITCEELGSLPDVIPLLRRHALKFIIYIDDLSFEDFETQYKGLKAVLEGSMESRPDNVLLYATSNRRHLVREFHSDRDRIDDEIHTNDTVQEKLSLADRFGLTITFPSPGQQAYLDIVEAIADKRQLNIDPELLRRQALQWERAHHGPSGRTARQFVDSLGGI